MYAVALKEDNAAQTEKPGYNGPLWLFSDSREIGIN